MGDLAVPGTARAAAVILWFNGLGFGLCAIPGIRNLAMGRDIPTIFGFPAYGGGGFERAGIKTTVPLLIGFMLVCDLEIVAGFFLWGGSMVGAIMALALLVPGAVFWWGFDLPIPWIFAFTRTVLIVFAWSNLK